MKFQRLLHTLLVLLCFASGKALAQFSIKMNGTSSTDMIAKVGDTTSNLDIRVVLDSPKADDGHKEADPVVLYTPLITASNTGPEGNFFIDTFNLNRSTSGSLPNTGSADGEVNLAVELNIAFSNTSGSDLFVRWAIRDGNSEDDDFLHIQTSDNFKLSQTSSGTGEINFDFDTACAVSSACVPIQTEDADVKDDIVFFVYGSTNAPSATAVGTNIDVDSIQGSGSGMFVQIEFSGVEPSGGLDIDNVTKGDGRLFADFSGGSLVTEMGSVEHKLIAFKTTGCVANSNIGSVFDTSVDILESEDFANDGRLTIKPLENGTTHNFSLALVNKYQMASEIITCASGTPESINALLEDQACYLITAGFQKEHPVLNAYRAIRDSFLLTTGSGQLFTYVYYQTAPHVTEYIIERPWLAWLIRTMAFAGLLLIPFITAFSLFVGIKATRLGH